VNDLERQVVHNEFSFPEKYLRFEVRNAHGEAIMRRQGLNVIQLCFVESNERTGIGERANSFHVIRMAVGEDDEINVLQGDGEFREMILNITEKAVVPGINKNLLGSVDEVSVRVVGRGVVPDEGVKNFR